jgi:DNA-binding MarR family transcriptional regulator
MARFRKIETDFWNDAFIEERTPEDRYFFIFLLTNPYTKQCGIYEITHKKIADLLGYDRSVIKSLIERFEGYGKIKYNDDTKEMCIINWGKYNLTRGGKPILDCVNAELKAVKDKTLIELIYKVLRMSR